MSPDEIVRRAALLLRSGAVPVSEFVGALDDATHSALFAALRAGERCVSGSLCSGDSRCPSEGDGLLCTRDDGHNGPHIACCGDVGGPAQSHNLAVWS